MAARIGGKGPGDQALITQIDSLKGVAKSIEVRLRAAGTYHIGQTIALLIRATDRVKLGAGDISRSVVWQVHEGIAQARQAIIVIGGALFLVYCARFKF